LHVETLRVGYRIHELEERLEARAGVERQLGLEAAYLESPGRIEERAIRELGMAAPAPDQLIFAEATP
jgi:cell division protein FtsL